MSKVFKILIVDDDSEWAKEISNSFTHSWEVDISNTVDDALKKISKHQYDVLVCDIKMPSIQNNMRFPNGGFVVCAEARMSQIQCVIIILTAHDSPQFEKDSLKESYNYIVKSFDVEEDIKKIQSEVEKIALNWFNTPPATNPFNVQHGSLPSKLVLDRISHSYKDTLLVKQLAESSGCAPRMLLCGVPGSGKSTTLITCRNHFKKLGWLTIFLPMSKIYSGYTAAEQADYFFRDLLSNLPVASDSLVKNLLTSIKSFKAQISAYGAKVGVELENGKGNSYKNDALDVVALQHLYDIFDKLSGESAKFVIILDDMNNVPHSAGFLQLLLKAVSTERFSRFSFAIVASYTCSFEEFEGNIFYPDIARFFAGKIYYLKNFTYYQFKEFVVFSLNDTQVVFEDQLIEEIFILTSGHPYLSVLLCHYLYECQLFGRVGVDKVFNALVSSKNELGNYFDATYNLQDDIKAVVRLIPYDFRCSSLKLFQKLLIDADVLPENIQKTTEVLLDKKIIVCDGREYFFKDKLFAKFLSVVSC